MSTERLREFFDVADKDDNGCISTNELVNILTRAFDGDRNKALTVANVSRNIIHFTFIYSFNNFQICKCTADDAQSPVFVWRPDIRRHRLYSITLP